MIPGAHGLLGAMVGGGTAYAVTDDPDDVNFNTGAGALGGAVLMQMPRPAIAWAGKNMRNFSAGYYDLDPLKNLTRFEKFIGNNKVISLKRNQFDAIKSLTQKYGFNNQNINAIKNLSLSNANKAYKKISAPTQFEDLQLELKRNGINQDAVKYYKRYKNNAGMSATPEEALLNLKKTSAEIDNKFIDGKINALQGRNLQLDELLRGKRISPNEHFRQQAINILEEQDLKRNYARVGELDRKWRHEIAKNEIHHIWSGAKYDLKRLNQAGYNYAGQYKWGDVEKYMQSVGSEQWKRDINSLANRVTRAIGLGDKNLMLNENTAVSLFRNEHTQDMKIKRKPSRVFQRMGRHASFEAFENPTATPKSIKNSLIERADRGQFKYTMRDLRDYADSWKNDSFMNRIKDNKYMRLLRRDVMHPLTPIPREIADKVPHNLKTFNKNLLRYQKMSKQKQRSKAGRDILRQLEKSYTRDQATKIIGQMKAQKAFAPATRGKFSLGGIGRVTTSYLEGGINATVDYRPFISATRDANGNRQSKVAMRMVTSDLSDLPMSGHTGYQNKIPFIVEEEFKTYNGRSGVDTYRSNITRDNPFYNDLKKWDELTDPNNKYRLNRTDIQNSIAEKGYSRDTLKLLKRQVRKNPKKVAQYALKRLPGYLGGAAMLGYVGHGLLSAYLVGQKEGEHELASIE